MASKTVPWMLLEPLPTHRLRIAPLRHLHTSALLDYQLRNAAHLKPWEPRRAPSFLQPAVFARNVQAWVQS